MKEGKGWKLDPKEKGGKEGGRKGRMEGGKRRKRKGDQDKSDEENSTEKVVKVGRKVEWRRGTKETKNKRKCLNLIPSALEYTCFPEAVLFGCNFGSPEDSGQVKSPCSDCL